MRRVLLDENLPHRLRFLFPQFDMSSVEFNGWKGMTNGRLLRLTTEAGFDAFLTNDRGIEHQQNVAALPFGIVALSDNHIEKFIPEVVARIASALSAVAPGACVRIDFS